MKPLPARLALTFVVFGAFPLFPTAPALQAKEAPVAWTPELTLQVRQVRDVDVSPDGKRVVFVVRRAVTEDDKSAYVSQLHLANSDGGDPVQLTHGEHTSDAPRWSPDGRTIGFLSDRMGKRQVWLLPANGGEARRLTEAPGGVTSFRWSPSGKQIAFTAIDPTTAAEEKAARQKDDAWVVDDGIKMSRLYVIAVDRPGPTRLLTRGAYSVGSISGVDRRGGYDWAPDGATIVFSHTRTPRPDDWPTADLSLVDVASGKVKSLAQTKAAEFSPFFSPDGKWIAYVASGTPPSWAGDGTVQIVSVAGGSPRRLAPTFDDFGRYSELLGWSADGKRLYFTEGRGTSVRLEVLPLEGNPEMLSTGEGTLGNVRLNATRTAFGFSAETASKPPEAYVSPAARWGPVAISRANRKFADVPLGRTEVERWKSPDGLEIEGLLTYPVGYAKGKRYPLLLVIHGGPMGAFTQQFVAGAGPYPVAAFAARGYLVLRANPRGSSGYGRKFRHANYGDWGKGDFRDLMAGVDHLIGRGLADPNRLGVMGWSYGGYMTAWTVTQTKRFKAASVGAGVTDLVSFTGTADIPGFLPDYFGAEPWDKPEVYRAHSPLFQAKGVTTPTLIQHGERDERVPLSQGQEFYNALKRQGCVTRMVTYPRTPHGIQEPKLLRDCMERNLEWFDKYLK